MAGLSAGELVFFSPPAVFSQAILVLSDMFETYYPLRGNNNKISLSLT